MQTVQEGSMGALWQDVRFGLRMLAKNPGFTAVAVLTLALGIGANAAIFSILDPLLLRKLPVRNPDELVLVHAAGTHDYEDYAEPYAYFVYRDNNSVFSGVIATANANTDRGTRVGQPTFSVTRNGQTTPVDGRMVSGNYFTVLGVRPFRGRLLMDSDSQSAEGNPVAVLSFDYWRNAFNGDDAAIGKTILIHNSPFTIVGVTPPDFFGVQVGDIPGIYLPFGTDFKKYASLHIIGRLKPGVSREQAQTGLEPAFKQVVAASDLPEIEKQQDMSHLILVPAARGISELGVEYSLPGKILMTVVALVLLIACSNVAGLLFARGTARRKEIAVRLALGAGRWRLVRQLLTESALLALVGAALGVLAAQWVSRILMASLATEHTTVQLVAGLSGRVLVFTGGVLIITVLLFGLGPALAATRGELSGGLKVHSSGSGGTVRHSWLSKSPAVIQVALAGTVLSGAGLLLHSLYNLETYDMGFDRDHVIAISFSCCATGRTPEQSSAAFEQMIAKAKSLPGVRSAGFSGYSQTTAEVGINVAVEGFSLRSVDEQHAFFNSVTSGYFETLGIPILAGRDFSEHDNADAQLAAIINRTMARHYFGNTNPIGKRFKFVEGRWPPLEIVGVVADSVYNDTREQTPDFIYLSRQQQRALHPTTGIYGVLDVRAIGKASALSGPLRDLVRSFDSAAEITYIKTLRNVIDESLHDDRLITTLCSIFSLLALALTCVGLYGTLSFSVVRRANEIGIRMALGARPGNIFALVIGQGIRLVIFGVVIGAAGALASASLLTKLLFGVKGADPVAFVGTSVLLILAAVAACYVPARRAMRVDPMVALREE
jgi:predicted permease